MAKTNGYDTEREGPAAVRTGPVSCPVCGGGDNEFLFEAKDRLHGGPGVFTYVQCSGCGLVYMNPQILPDDLAKVYPPDYGPHHVLQSKPQSERSLKAELRKIPFVSALCAELTPAGRLLDVGCGAGAFLSRIQKATGCEVRGVDNSEEAVKTAKQMYGVEVFHGTILEAPFADGSFDAITAWSFLEHVPNPRQVLRRMSQLLKAQGRCIIGVPNTASFNARVFRDRWYHLDCPRHLQLFSPDTLSRLIVESGLTIEGIAFDPGARGLVQSIRYRFGDDRIPLRYRKKGAGVPLLKAALRPWARVLAWLGQADIMVVCARKSDGPAGR